MKAILFSRIQKLQNFAQAYSLTGANVGTVGDSITIDGTKHDIAPQQKDLVEKVAKQAQLDITEAFRIVSQQSRLGITDIDTILKAYMRERTGILRVVKCLLRLEMGNDFNAKTRLLAKEIVSKIKEDKQFLQKVVRGIKERVDQQLPANITSDPQYASLWSRQV
jgi:hypothetical protein